MRSHRLASALTVLAALFVGLAPSPARADFSTYLYTAGHADIGVDYSASGGLSLFYELSGNAVINGSALGTGIAAAAGDVSVIVPESVLMTGSAALPAPFAGNPLYTLLQSSSGSSSRPFLGFGAEEIGDGVFVNNTLNLALTGFNSSVAGGQFVLFQTGFWANPDMNTANGLTSADAITLNAGGHDHYNLGFTAAGIYDLTFTATGALTTGGTVSASAVYRFVVGDQPTPAVPEPSSLVMAGVALGGLGLAAARRKRTARVA